MKRERVEGVDKEGKSVSVWVRLPTAKEKVDAQVYSASVFNEARKAGAMLRGQLDGYMRKEGMWTEEMDNRVFDIDTEIEDVLSKLDKGKKGFEKLSEARKAAIRVYRLRMQKLFLLSRRRDLDMMTADGQAEDARHHFLSACCILNDEGKRYFPNIDEYMERADEPFVLSSSAKLSAMVNGYDEDWEKKLPENEFLKKYGFVNEKMQLVNKDGKPVDDDYKEIVEKEEVKEPFEEFDNDLS